MFSSEETTATYCRGLRRRLPRIDACQFLQYLEVWLLGAKKILFQRKVFSFVYLFEKQPLTRFYTLAVSEMEVVKPFVVKPLSYGGKESTTTSSKFHFRTFIRNPIF